MRLSRRDHKSVDIAAIDNPWLAYMRQRRHCQSSRLYGCTTRAFACSLEPLDQVMTDASPRLVVVCGNRRTAAPRGCTPAHSTPAYNAFSNRC